MFRFRLDIAGEVQIDRGIARFSDALSDYRPIWGVIEDDFYAQEAAQFASEGAEGGEKWKELSVATANWKATHFPGQPILVRTGNLKRSLTKTSDPNAVHVRERKTLTLGSRIPYAIFHQSPAPRKHLPRREEIRFPEKFKRSTMHHLQTYMVQVATQSGLRSGLTPLDVSQLQKYFGSGIPPRGTSPVRVGNWRVF